MIEFLIERVYYLCIKSIRVTTLILFEMKFEDIKFLQNSIQYSYMF